MTKKSIVFLSIFLAIAVLIAGGVLWYSGEVKNQIALQEKEIQQIKFAKSAEELVWYNIPELGIRFKTTLRDREDLMYMYTGLESYTLPNGSLIKYERVEFSSRGLEKIAGCNESLGFVNKYHGKLRDSKDVVFGTNAIEEGRVIDFGTYFIESITYSDIEPKKNCFIEMGTTVGDMANRIWMEKVKNLKSALNKTAEPIDI